MFIEWLISQEESDSTIATLSLTKRVALPIPSVHFLPPPPYLEERFELKATVMLWKLLQRTFFFQDIASWVLSKIPFVLEHNFGKYAALRRCFYLTALEQLEGDYMEFGVFTGSSFVMAIRSHEMLKKISQKPTRFIGFDSFEGFGEVASYDQHPFYKDDFFKVSPETVIKNIKKRSRGYPVEIVKGYFSDSFTKHSPQSLGVKKLRICLIDCDLKEPAADCLKYIAPLLQPGSALVFDDYFSFKASEKLGIAGALNEFLEQHPDIKLRHLFNYGMGGAVFLVSAIGSAQAKS